MIAVIFEVLPNTNAQNDYLNLASKLRPLLDEIEGFISIERFQSLTHEHKLLSLSYWQDEAAIQTWRNNILHQQAQQKGKHELFSDFNIKIAPVIREYSMLSSDLEAQS